MQSKTLRTDDYKSYTKQEADGMRKRMSRISREATARFIGKLNRTANYSVLYANKQG
jgi:hypothetical protein